MSAEKNNSHKAVRRAVTSTAFLRAAAATKV